MSIAMRRFIQIARITNVSTRPALLGQYRLFSNTSFRFNVPQETVAPKESDPEGTLVKLRANEKIDPVISETLNNLNFRALTKVQDESIGPAIDEENGLVVRAKTGTGKTLAYLIPILNQLYPSRSHSLKNKHRVFHLIIVPTRDLAQQIERELTLFCKGHPELKKIFLTRVDVLTGSVRSHLESLFNPSIVIATPGRLIRTLEDKKRFGIRFRDLQTVTLDEADRLLDAGFGKDIDRIHELLTELNVGPQRGVDGLTFKYLLYSATIDKNVSEFAKQKIGENFKYIDCVNEEDTEAHENIRQVLVQTKSFNDSIHAALAHCIRNIEDEADFKGVLFLPTVKAVEWAYDTIKSSCSRINGRQVYKVNGQMTQAARDRNLLLFRRSQRGVLVATDVAARGLDFPDITTVLQASASSEIASYIHKIGRTGRAGKTGEAFLFSHEAESRFVKQLQKEKQIEFNETITYEDFQKDRELFKYSSHDDAIVEAVQSLCLFYSQASNQYGFSTFKCMQQVLEFYREITDSNEKLNLERKYLSVLNLPRHEAEQVFEVPDDYRQNGRRGGSGSRFNKFDGPKTGGYQRNNGRNDRGGYKSDSRGGYGGSRDRDNYRSNNRDNYRSNSRDGYKSNNRDGYKSNRDGYKGNRDGYKGKSGGSSSYERVKDYD
ncbi:P-loop containing nucleoside triphosphate hydrolase protein [Yamadazyma tenuis]|nr:P-loop containing nucleoside triphosphate hydrolase protein [Yamadazyma tenuis]